MNNQIINVTALYGMDKNAMPMSIPFYESPISAGFPSPADGLEQVRLQPNDYLVRNEDATFFARVTGDSMINAHIIEGDVLVIDRSVIPAIGQIVIAEVDGEFAVKYLGKRHLIPAHPTMPKIPFTDFETVTVIGTVRGSMRLYL